MLVLGMRLADHAVSTRISQSHCTLFYMSLFACFMFDRVVLTPAKLEGRYQIIHCLGNIVVSVFAWEDASHALLHPSTALQRESNLCPYIVTLAIHTYHVLAFRPLSPADWKHHLLMMGGTLPIVAWFPSGRLASLASFAASGAPGAICYAAISLRKNHLISRLEEKRINAAVNTWFRGPLVTVSGYVIFVAIWDHEDSVSDNVGAAIGTCLAILVFWNGQFYGRQVVENYGSCIMQCHTGNDVPAPTVC